MFLYTFIPKMPRSKSALEECKEVIRKRERILAKEKADARRFNDPLKLFVKRKYNNIYKEYVKLYKRMLGEVPARKNLCRTLVFKQFLLDHPDQQDNKQSDGAEGREQYNKRTGQKIESSARLKSGQTRVQTKCCMCLRFA